MRNREPARLFFSLHSEFRTPHSEGVEPPRHSCQRSTVFETAAIASWLALPSYLGFGISVLDKSEIQNPKSQIESGRWESNPLGRAPKARGPPLPFTPNVMQAKGVRLKAALRTKKARRLATPGIEASFGRWAGCHKRSGDTEGVFAG